MVVLSGIILLLATQVSLKESAPQVFAVYQSRVKNVLSATPLWSIFLG